MRRFVAFLAICLLACFVSEGISSEPEQDDEPPVNIEHLGVSRNKHVQEHSFRITLMNRHDQPIWFLFPGGVGEPLVKGDVFGNRQSSNRQPFDGLRYDGDKGPVIQIDFGGSDRFDAFHLPANGRIVLDGWWTWARKDFKYSELSELIILEAQELRVNDKTLLEKWLPYDTMSGVNAEAGRGTLTSLNYDKKRRGERIDFPAERVEFVRAAKIRKWIVRFEPPVERANGQVPSTK